MKALVTGAGGFVGTYLKRELSNNGYDATGTDLVGEDLPIDLLDINAVTEMIRLVKPEYIFHLAGQSSVSLSWKSPQKTFLLNVNGTLNLLDAVRECGGSPRILIIGSGDEYGKLAVQDCPVSETYVPEPQTPYAMSKYTQEKMALLYAKAHGMDIVLTRSFNHTGPGQPKGFVIPDFASQIVRIENGVEPALYVGNLEAERDFSDVRDVVCGYRLLAQQGKRGEVYNVGSGKPRSIRYILDTLLAMAAVKIEIKEDPAKMRPVDTPVIVGDIRKMKQDTRYEPIYTMERTLEDTLQYWRNVERNTTRA